MLGAVSYRADTDATADQYAMLRTANTDIYADTCVDVRPVYADSGRAINADADADAACVLRVPDFGLRGTIA